MTPFFPHRQYWRWGREVRLTQPVLPRRNKGKEIIAVEHQSSVGEEWTSSVLEVEEGSENSWACGQGASATSSPAADTQQKVKDVLCSSNCHSVTPSPDDSTIYHSRSELQSNQKYCLFLHHSPRVRAGDFQANPKNMGWGRNVLSTRQLQIKLRR